MKKILIILGLIFLTTLLIPYTESGSATGTCGSGCPSECAVRGVSCTSTPCTIDNPGTKLSCTCSSVIPGFCFEKGISIGCVTSGSITTCSRDCGMNCCITRAGTTECSTSPSCDSIGLNKPGCTSTSSSCTYQTSSTIQSCTWSDCACSGTGCNPANNGQRCDGCSYYSVSLTSESCNNLDDNCNGQIDEGLTQSCGNCGTRTCSSGAWTACTGEGVCSPGTVQACNDCGTKTCTSSCQFNSCTGDNSIQSCGKCGTKTCSADGNWIGCIEGACEIVFAYWSDMTEAPTNKADNLDKVKIITLSEQLLIGKTINVEIYKSNTLFGLGILDWLIPDSLVNNLIQTVDSQGKAVLEWTVPDVNEITYYYAYSHVDPYSSKASWYLEVSPTDSNSPPSVVISFPNYNLPENYNFNVNEIITFTQSSSDIDSILTNYLWDFDGGAPATSTSQNPVAVTYSTPGSEYISLEVTDDRGAVSTSNVGIMIDDPLTNQAPLAVITSPESGKTYSRKITVDARKSTDDRTPFEQLLFIWYFDNIKDPEHSNVSGTAGAYFDKVFDTAGLHSVAVMIDDGE